MNQLLRERMNDGQVYAVSYNGKVRNVKFLADGSNLARGFVKVEQLSPEVGVRTFTVGKIGAVTVIG
ncbi:hypothetical protein EBR57_11080 [bacterium]|nr:hypothetical protein [bacterium]